MTKKDDCDNDCRSVLIVLMHDHASDWPAREKVRPSLTPKSEYGVEISRNPGRDALTRSIRAAKGKRSLVGHPRDAFSRSLQVLPLNSLGYHWL